MGLNTLGIIGAGQMGSGIAQVAAQSGLSIILNDISDEMVARGTQIIERSLDRMVQRSRIKLDDRDRIMRRIGVTANLADLAATDFVLEAVVEDEDAKVALFQKLDSICPPEVIF